MSRFKENDYIIGIDVGYKTAIVAYRNGQHGPRFLDRTGGYGQLSVPTTILCIDEDWVIGEEVYTQAMAGDQIIENLLQAYLKDTSGNYEGYMLIFLYHLVDYIYQVNPNAKVKEVRLCFTSDLNSEQVESLKSKLMKSLMTQVNILSADECVIAYKSSEAPDVESFIWMNYGNYSMKVCHYRLGDEVQVKQLASLHDIAGQKIELAIYDMIIKVFQDLNQNKILSKEDELVMAQMTRLYTPYIFKKYQQGGDLRITFNHTFPPFQGLIEEERISSLVAQFEEKFYNTLGYSLKQTRCKNLLLTGNGFKMVWPKKVVERRGDVQSEEVIEAIVLGLLSDEVVNQKLEIRYMDKSAYAIGVKVLVDGEETFHPILNSGDKIVSESYETLLVVEGGANQSIEISAIEEEGLKRLDIINVKNDLDQPLILVGIKLIFDHDCQMTHKVSYYEM